jgi:hypothetical protein
LPYYFTNTLEYSFPPGKVYAGNIRPTILLKSNTEPDKLITWNVVSTLPIKEELYVYDGSCIRIVFGDIPFPVIVMYVSPSPIVNILVSLPDSFTLYQLLAILPLKIPLLITTSPVLPLI